MSNEETTICLLISMGYFRENKEDYKKIALYKKFLKILNKCKS